MVVLADDALHRLDVGVEGAVEGLVIYQCVATLFDLGAETVDLLLMFIGGDERIVVEKQHEDDHRGCQDKARTDISPEPGYSGI